MALPQMRHLIIWLLISQVLACGSKKDEPQHKVAIAVADGPTCCAGPEEPDGGTIDVKVLDGEPLSPAHKRAFAHFAKVILSEALEQAIQNAFDQVSEKLELKEEYEKQLVLGTHDFGSPDRDGDVWGICLLSPGRSDMPPKTVRLVSGDRSWRFTRVYVELKQPMAIMSRHRLANGVLTQADLVLTSHLRRRQQMAGDQANRS